MSDTDRDTGVQAFERDVARAGRYLYTGGDRLSCRLANARITEGVLRAARFEGAHVIDIGCGDGTYTQELAVLARPAHVHGVDPAADAIDFARGSVTPHIPVSFDVASAYSVPHPAGAFDVALLRVVLHHMDRPVDALREALRVAPTVVVVEPNGLNPGLKLLERYSEYHLAHGERSFPPRRLDRWVEGLGARTIHREWIGFVPMFSPDWYAKSAKRLEVVLERVPGVRAIGCAQYVFTASTRP